VVRASEIIGRVITILIAQKELESRWNRLPVRTDTSAMIRHKNDLQTQLDEVEQAIKVFSKPKVFVKND
jgi:hypothetical protein